MKKILLFLCAVMASFAANAATGNYFISGQFNNWQHAQIQFDKNGTEYSITLDGTGLQNFAGEFLICGGTKGNADWNDKIGGVSNMVVDKEYTYQVGGGNMSVSGIIAYPLTITFNTATKKIKITGAEAENEYDTVYLIGDFGDGWSETRTDAALSLKAGTDNVWEGDVTFKGTTNYFKMKAGAYVYGTGGGDVVVAMGSTYTASQSGNAFVASKGDYHVEFVLDKNADSGKLTVTAQGEDPVPPTPSFAGWYVNIIGDFNGWVDNGVVPDSEGIATLKGLAIGTSEFKIKIWDGTADVYYSNGGVLPLDEWVTITADAPANMTVAGAAADSEYNVEYDCAKKAIKVTLVGGGDDPVPPTPTDYTKWYVNVIGTFNDWKDNGVNPNADGIATLEGLAIGTGEFKVKIWNGTADVYYSTGDALPLDEWVTIAGNSAANMTVAGAAADSEYNVEFDCAKNAIKVTLVGGGDDPVPPTPEMALYLAGEINEWNAGDEAYKFTQEGDVFTLRLETLSGQFKVTTADWSKNWGAEGVFGEPEGPVTIEKDTEVNAWSGSGCNFELAEALEAVTVTFTYHESGASKLIVNGTVTGIEAVAVEAQAAEAVYYNLQGVRVAQPVKGGLYIVNRAGKVAKEIVR